MIIYLKGKQATIKKIYAKRCMIICPFHESKSNSADLDLTLVGEYAGKFYCYGCGESGQISDSQLERILNLKATEYVKEIKDLNSLTLDYQMEAHTNRVLPPWKGISTNTASKLQMGWDKGCRVHGKYRAPSYTFPMRDKVVTGIHHRYQNGNKGMEGNLGLFIPLMVFDPKKTLYITEGVSDLSVILELGLQGIARPNSRSCAGMVEDWITNNMGEDALVTIVSDNDYSGIEGANNLLDYLRSELDIVCVLLTIPHHNDLRQMYEATDKETVKEFINCWENDET